MGLYEVMRGEERGVSYRIEDLKMMLGVENK